MFCSILGTMYYEAKLKNYEVRDIVRIGVYLAMLQALLSYGFAMRWNLSIGLPDIYCVLFSEIAFGVFVTSLSILPTMALFAKITPPRIEGTIFAMLTGTTNLAYQVISPLIGAWLNNNFIIPPVTADNLESYPKLMAINICFSCFGLMILPLIPLKKHINMFQA